MNKIDIDSPYTVTPEQIAFYRENGFIKLKDVLSPETLKHYGHEITKKVAELNTQNVPMEQRSTYAKAFIQIMNLWTHSEVVKEFVLGKRLGGIAAALMGTRGVRIYHDQALYKEPGGGLTPWHAGSSATTGPLPPTQIDDGKLIPLQETPMEMGPLAFCPKSQKFTYGRDLEISDESEMKLSEALKKFGKEESRFDLGEVSFHAGWTFHRAGGNSTTHPREVMTIIYIDSDMLLAQPKNKNQQNDWNTWCPGVSVGGVIDSPLNPVVV